MATILKQYQERALNELLENANLFLNREGKGEVCVFKSPTGSGKTVVMARFIELLIKERPKDNLCFIWLSVGKGDLHIQSKESLTSIFGGSPRVSLVEEEFSGSREIIKRNEVVVGSWNKLYLKESQSGEWKSLIMKDGEKINFREVLQKTNEKRKIILIIDESSFGHQAPRVSEVRRLIDAEVILEVSATPPAKRELFEMMTLVEVKPEDVIGEGMIKKELIINPGLENAAGKMHDEMGSQDIILELAFQKRKELKREFKKNDSEINPLVLIQIPDADQGERKYQATIDFLKKKGATIENGKVGVWLSEKKTDNLKGITDNDDDTDWLIFKQAIGMGWDCPRAHILVKLRDPGNSETFEIQVVGRILRTPERKHYGDDLLDVGYIYSNSERIRVKPDEYKMDIIKNKSAVRKKGYEKISLPSFYKSRLEYGDIKANFQEVFEEACIEYFGIKDIKASDNKRLMLKKGVNIDRERYIENIISDTGIPTKDFDRLEGELPANAKAKITSSVSEVEDKFYKFLEDHTGPFGNKKRSAPRMATAIYVWFKKYLGFKLGGNDAVLIQSAIIDRENRIHFENILQNALKKYGAVKKADKEEKERKLENISAFELPPVEYFNENVDEEVERVHRYAMKPCYLSRARSNPEKHFENFLEENSDKIVWWWKNGENKKECFGIKYKYAGEAHTFYPDYLVKFNDKKIGIFETKDPGDQDGATLTKAKAEALQKYIKEQNKKSKKLFGGIVIEKNNDWRINRKEMYDWSKCEKNDWSDWEKLKF